MSIRISATLAAAAAAFAIAAPVRAAERPVEIGGGAGVISSWFTSSPLSGGDLRVSIPSSEDGDVELLVALQTPQPNDRYGLYGIQYKHRLVLFDDARIRPFITFGAVGVFASARRHSVFTFPF